jgi:hypothetical protein
VVVSPVPGEPKASGTALRNALAGITDASEANPYLLRVEPGIFDLGAFPLAMKPYVDVEGSGEGLTRLRGVGTAALDAGTVVGADHSELRFLTVENTGGGAFAVAVSNPDGAARFRGVTALASGASESYAFYNKTGAPSLHEVRGRAVATGPASGVYNEGASPTMRSVTLEAQGGEGFAVTNAGAAGRLTVLGSVLAGVSGSVRNLAPYEVRLAASQILGPIHNGGAGAFRCAAVYDAEHVLLPPDCSVAGACVDGDGDGFFAASSGCGRAPFDCRDDAATAHPGAAEICGDGLDNDCGGAADEGCPSDATPETWIDDAPAALSNDATPEFAFSSDEPGTFVCTIDGGAPEACASPYAPTLADGPHAFTVAAIDDAGNQDASPAAHLWVIDTQAPETTITSGPPAIENSVSVQLTFEADEVRSSFACRSDGGAFAACTSPHTVAVGDGAHTFEVRATDPAGNVDPSPATRAWTTDTSTPDTGIDSGPSGPVSSTSATFTFSSPDAGGGATFECSRDLAAFTTCASPITYTSLTEAAHNFRVRVRDAGDNLDPSPASRDWTVDVTAPDTTIATGPTGTAASTSATFTFTSNEMVTYACNTDAAGWAGCSTPHQPTGFSQGPHTLEVRATDGAGNTDATPASRTWTVDTDGPTVMITGGPAAGATSGPFVTFTFTTSEGTPQCRIDGAAFASCTSPASFSLNDATHTFSVRGSDAVGNTTTVTRTWNVDCAGQTTGPDGVYLFPMNESSGQVVDNVLTSAAEGVLGSNAQVEVVDPQRINPGRFGRGLNFLAAERDTMRAINHVGATHDHTIELWVRPRISTATNTLFSMDEISISFTSTAGMTRFSYEITDAAGSPVVVSSGGMPANVWYYLVATYTGTVMRLYVNGAQVATGTLSYPGAPFSMASLTLSSASGSVDGDLDEVFVGSTAFTATDVLRRYCPQ